MRRLIILKALSEQMCLLADSKPPTFTHRARRLSTPPPSFLALSLISPYETIYCALIPPRCSFVL